MGVDGGLFRTDVTPIGKLVGQDCFKAKSTQCCGWHVAEFVFSESPVQPDDAYAGLSCGRNGVLKELGLGLKAFR